MQREMTPLFSAVHEEAQEGDGTSLLVHIDALLEQSVPDDVFLASLGGILLQHPQLARTLDVYFATVDNLRQLRLRECAKERFTRCAGVRISPAQQERSVRRFREKKFSYNLVFSEEDDSLTSVLCVNRQTQKTCGHVMLYELDASDELLVIIHWQTYLSPDRGERSDGQDGIVVWQPGTAAVLLESWRIDIERPLSFRERADPIIRELRSLTNFLLGR